MALLLTEAVEADAVGREGVAKDAVADGNDAVLPEHLRFRGRGLQADLEVARPGALQRREDVQRAVVAAGRRRQRRVDGQQAVLRGINTAGPYPADTLLKRAVAGEFDGVVAMYHDQGHIALKLIAFNRAVNVTLGLPIIRTSPSHGTAFDIAWQGTADPTGMIEAIRVAVQLAGTAPRDRKTWLWTR